jgi:hypothetical protein
VHLGDYALCSTLSVVTSTLSCPFNVSLLRRWGSPGLGQRYGVSDMMCEVRLWCWWVECELYAVAARGVAAVLCLLVWSACVLFRIVYVCVMVGVGGRECVSLSLPSLPSSVSPRLCVRASVLPPLLLS